MDIHKSMDNWRVISKKHGYPCWYPWIFFHAWICYEFSDQVCSSHFSFIRLKTLNFQNLIPVWLLLSEIIRSPISPWNREMVFWLYCVSFLELIFGTASIKTFNIARNLDLKIRGEQQTTTSLSLSSWCVLLTYRILKLRVLWKSEAFVDEIPKGN